ncbi:MAG: DUF2147 domain-containing protein [Algoriphagus sp.]|jgi:uncharacterized protein (DUF2147 family)|nr:DUF2147 domain-containing protein [Algoriphagus sp.]
MLFKLLLTLSLGCLAYSFINQSSKTSKADDILGIWTNQTKDARFEICKRNESYFGRIIWGTGGDSKDSKNPDPKLRTRDLVGLAILSDFVFEGSRTWSDGTIYDPKQGKTYSCILTLISPNQLEVRGYIGFSLFGRTETWTRIN